MIVDQSTVFGRRAQERLASESTGWFTTITASGQPKSIPVWFLWRDDESLLIYSQPNALKMRNIRINPKVSFNLDSDGQGGNIVRLEGTAEAPENFPLLTEVEEYFEKYREQIPSLGISAEELAATYSAAIVIRPERLTGI